MRHTHYINLSSARGSSIRVEYNRRASDVGLLANVVAAIEAERLPSLIFGASFDRIGTPRGRSIY